MIDRSAIPTLTNAARLPIWRYGIGGTMDEFQKRDEALDKLEKARTDLLVYGRRVADALVRAQGTVTSIDVLAQLRREGYDVDAFDKRWIGAVFRRGWVRVGYEATGSHGRPVARWALKGSNNAA